MQLQDRPAHERVCRERVGAVTAAVDDQHAVAGARQQQGGGRPGAPRADDDGVKPRRRNRGSNHLWNSRLRVA